MDLNDSLDNPNKPRRGMLNNVWIQFSVSLLIVMVLFITTLYSGIFLSHEKSINEGFRSKASSIFNSIVLTRQWNAVYGGVYVEKKEGVESNPYLKNPDIKTEDGKIYTKKNPALMTREISEIAEKEGAFKFHITSLKLVNKNNAPDDFEKNALVSFENGVSEVFAKEEVEGVPYYRYMAPLRVEEACLKCHDDKGYNVGDIRGGISVRFPIMEDQKQLERSRLITAALFLVTIILLVWLISRLVFKLYKRLSKAEQKLRELLNTDALTGLSNRRSLVGGLYEEVERARRYKRNLCCIMIDIDHFKKLNDTYGHQAGDEVLMQIGTLMRTISRNSDLTGRYGGEEFIILLPETDIEGALTAAEKIRAEIEKKDIRLDDDTVIRITASFGVSEISRDDEMPLEKKAADLVGRADKALYQAKERGRNRVCVDDSLQA